MEIIPTMQSGIYPIVLKTESRLHIQLPEDVEHYAVLLLSKYARELWSQRPLMIQWLELAERELLRKSVDARDIRDIGDSALMLSSFQRKQLAIQGIHSEFYPSLGRFAYSQTAMNTVGASSSLYYKLSEAFDPMVTIFSSIFDSYTARPAARPRHVTYRKKQSAKPTDEERRIYDPEEYERRYQERRKYFKARIENS